MCWCAHYREGIMINYKDKVWKESPELIREYYDNIVKYELLCEEVQYILGKLIKKTGVEVASISSRSKTLESFCEKIHRKNYNKPFELITDFAGARIVFLYEKDRNEIEEAIEASFEIIEKVDKILDSEEDRFGYGALHYIVKLKDNHTGARYDEIKSFCCEIQVRTILQDAWSVVAHHLSYKQESDVPKHLRRKLNALSGLFETADDQFQYIRDARNNYRTQVTDAIEHNDIDILSQDIEVDSLLAFLKWKMPERKQDSASDIAELTSEIKQCGISSLGELQNVLNRTKEARSACEAAYPPYDPELSSDTTFSVVGEIRQALQFAYDDYFDTLHESFAESSRLEKSEFMHLVKNT